MYDKYDRAAFSSADAADDDELPDALPDVRTAKLVM